MTSTAKTKPKVAKKDRNPRITVCYTPSEYEEILTKSAAAGLKKSQYVHDESFGQELHQIMTDEQTKALISLWGCPKRAGSHPQCPPEEDSGRVACLLP